jgi:glycosyl transferase family 87
VTGRGNGRLRIPVRGDGLFAVAAAVELAALLLLPAPANPDKPGVSGGLRTAAAQLRGEGPPVDLVQDYVGARRLVGGGDSYPLLTRAFASVGIVWQANHRSTHPPSAFLLALPIAWVPWKTASAVWAALMLAAIAGAWWALGASRGLSAALAPLTLLWPPAAWSLGQLTPLWLLGVALAWRLRDRPVGAGAAIALASLTKLLPALSLVPLFVAGRARALRGFAFVWAAASAVLLLRPTVLERYFHVARGVAREQAARGENSALLWAAGHEFGVAGLAAGLALVGGVIAVSLRRLRTRRALDRWSWDVWSWASVALLPIAWIYSLLPLLPALARTLRCGRPAARPLALVTLAMPFFVDPFGLPGGTRLALATACLGLALLVAAPAAARNDRL